MKYNLIIFKVIFMIIVCTHKNESKHIVKCQSFEIHVYRTHYKNNNFFYFLRSEQTDMLELRKIKTILRVQHKFN